MREPLPEARVQIVIHGRTRLWDLVWFWWHCRIDRMLRWIEAKADKVQKWGASR